ncbi:MAG: two-component system response regulator [Planctomycetes bacterium RBG_13_44_8b]|nr:MAG: two-component system response regulator [Planctomycetes bacterium RBG_13_44_8b]
MQQQVLKSILLVEDDIVDAMAVKRAFDHLHVTNELVHVINGEEALDYLKNIDNVKPQIILLDLNMPRMNGIEFMKIIKADDNLKNIPVVILTTSNAEQDRVQAFNLGIAGYIVKPVDHNNFIDMMSKIHQYWEMTLFPESYYI